MNLLPLESFRKAIGFNPYHFWGLTNSKVPVNSACSTLVSEDSWQDADAVGRSEMRAAIERAEDKLAEYLGYHVAPKYRQDKVLWPKYHDAAVWRQRATGADGRRVALHLPYGYLQGVGVETLTSLGTAAVTLSDVNNDGLLDTFTATLNVAVADTSKVEIYFVSVDRWDGSGLSDKWRIAPVTVTTSGNTVTVKGPSWIIVKPLLYQGYVEGGIKLDPNLSTNYAANLEFALKTINTEGETIDTAQAVLYWETIPCGWWFCWCNYNGTYSPADSRYDPAAVGLATARVGVQNAVMSDVLPDTALKNATTGIWQPVDWAFYREPDSALVRYVSGKPLENRNLNVAMESAVWHLAAAELSRPICGCQAANRELYRWQFNAARAAGANDEQYQISASDLDCPFGTSYGAIYAWRMVKQLRLLPATSF